MEDTLTAAEVTNLWNSYLGNSMAIGVTTYFIKTSHDSEVIELLEDALDLAEYQTKGARELFDQFDHPRPQGYSMEEFNVKAPTLYKDNIILLVNLILAQDAGTLYSVALSTATHSDVRQYYLTCANRTNNLINQIVELMEKKGLFHPKVSLPVPSSIEKVERQSFVGNWFSGKRPLNAEEITQVTSNLTNIEVSKEFFRSFIQITSSKQLKEHYKRGEEIAKKHSKILKSLLADHNLPQPPTWESEITESTVNPFSERMMLYKVSVFAASIVGRYGTAVSTSMRKDVGVDFYRLMAEFAVYGEDTLNLMIEEGFLDQTPLAKDLDK